MQIDLKTDKRELDIMCEEIPASDYFLIVIVSEVNCSDIVLILITDNENMMFYFCLSS